MEPEIRKQLEEVHALAKDNHRMLRAILRHQWYSFFTTVIVWAVLLLTPFYLYQQYLQPLISRFQATPGGSTSTDIGKLINSIKGGL